MCCFAQEYLEEDILIEIMNQERDKHRRRYHNYDVLQVVGRIRKISKIKK